MIELADMNPPYHEMSPMRVLQKIVKKDPPMLAIPSRWWVWLPCVCTRHIMCYSRSKDFNDIIAKCLMKTPSSRPSAEELLKHPFIASVSVNKPLRILYQVSKCLLLLSSDVSWCVILSSGTRKSNLKWKKLWKSFQRMLTFPLTLDIPRI